METRVSKTFLLTVLFSVVSLMSSAQTVSADTLPQQDSITAKVNSTPQTVSEKRKAMLTPEYYTQFVGASFFTIATIEKEFDVTPARILNLTFFYDFGDCFVGMEANKEGVVIQMTLRLYADTAEDFIQKAIDYGYKYAAKGENVNIRSNTGKLLPDVYGTKVKRYSKTTKNGNVYLEVSTSSKYANEYEIAIFRAK
ncbi:MULTISPECIES: hypothetical protein [unclassified Butyricimonas]|jgi:hypothetical protein|uniref:hypothetical protein n=1 Tax=unclassified Butyricimonas TaxID=2637652 RepID=UPI000B3946CA|nr:MULTISPECIES: hypothetical protein [unclassified Butyricimonas]OUN64125.1 hypothetical protein B5G13_13975 [Butyricimonas sp. An62]